MRQVDRRGFLGDVGRGMLVLGAGALVGARGVDAFLDDDGKRLDFGDLEPLAAMMQDLEPDALLPALVRALDGGTDLKTLVAAAALANARTFGGEDYIGYHCTMALLPAYQMTGMMPAGREALPVLKVLHRNTERMRQQGGSRREVLRPLAPPTPEPGAVSRALVDAGRDQDTARAERLLAQVVADPTAAYDVIQPMVRDNIDVHQVVLAWRSWDMLSLTGPAHAHTLLRQCVRHCVDRERSRIRVGNGAPTLRGLMPRLLEELATGGAVARPSDDAWITRTALAVATGARDGAAELIAAALAEGRTVEDIGAVLSQASVLLLLRDPGRAKADGATKPRGSVHGASLGVHACDSAHAWRNIARVSGGLTQAASLIAGAWHTAGQADRIAAGSCFDAHRDEVAKIAPEKLGGALVESIRGGDQPRAAAMGARWTEAGLDAGAAFGIVLAEMLPADGALHHEKFFRTACEGHREAREVHRADWLAAVARVAASGYGFESAGWNQAEAALVG